MPSFYFHLDFELFPESQSPENINRDPCHFYLPPPGTDIFKASLPSHKTTSRKPDTRPAGHSKSNHISSGTDASKAPETTQAQQDDNIVRSLSGLTVSGPDDWRFGPISIESIDMAAVTPDAARHHRTKSSGFVNSAAGPGPGSLVSKGVFVPSDPKNTELGWGIVHLYRDGEETPGLYSTDGNTSSSKAAGSEASLSPLAASKSKEVPSDDCTTLCILAVPSYLTPSDFLGFVGPKTGEDVSHFRMIRTGQVNRYMVLMKFRDAKKARDWRREWNGCVFNSMEPENCHVVFVKSISFRSRGGEGDTSSFPGIESDPFMPQRTSKKAVAEASGAATTSSPSTTSTTTLLNKPLAPPTPALVELPTCPVCLERMDETTGLLTILCQHVFHCACLQKWRGSGCPVCRYTQGDGLGSSPMLGRTENGEVHENVCSVCRSESNLWICLICGNVGCGRYDEAHAFSHYEETSHCYAMDVDTQRVWDYAGDGYVHRLIQNKSDGKLVELPSALNRSRGAGNSEYTALGGDYVPREKLDNIGMEYTYLLTSQLDSQRLYFEEKFAQAADKASKATQAAESALANEDRVTKCLETLQRSFDELSGETLPSLERGRERLERRAEKFSEMARKLEKEWKEEKAINGSLMERIAFMEKELATLKVAKSELEEQNRDLTFFISGQEKLQGLGEEVQQGTLTVGEAPTPGKRKKGKGKR
ncbi:MAG: hypothetical protein M1825_006244 [Sarcosagium campestre]|nr:MAG: hypothetical protein M1825_006244 [Sarcosagium campestre]